MAFGRFGAGQPLGHGGQLFAAGNDIFLHGLEIVAELQELRGRGRAFSFGELAGAQGLGMIDARFFRALARGFGLGVQARNFVALGGELQFDAAQLGAGLIALMGGGDQRFFRFHLLRDGPGHVLFARGDFTFNVSQLRLHLVGG